MKCKVEIECTPEEARTFLGLPDVQPMQGRIMAEMETRLLAEMDRFSPDAVLKTWMSLAPQSPDQFREMISRMFQAGGTGRV